MTFAEPVTDKQKESCAVATMRRMVEKYADQYHIPFEDAFFRFTQTCAYDALFDFDTGIWREGPDYLMCIFEEALADETR